MGLTSETESWLKYNFCLINLHGISIEGTIRESIVELLYHLKCLAETLKIAFSAELNVVSSSLVISLFHVIPILLMPFIMQ